MTIEINHANSEYIYRQNPFQPREIDRRKNQHRARWERWQVYTTAENARRAIFDLEKEGNDDND